MFVPVACSQCGKPFQVPEAAVGQTTTCPWCAAAVLALPIATPAAPPPATPVLQPKAKTENRGLTPTARQEPSEPEPLPLDDLPEPPDFHSPALSAELPAGRRGRWFRMWMVPAALLVLFVVALVTLGVLRYKQGDLTGWESREFSPPDKSFTVELLGRAKEDPDAAAGETRFVSTGWYSGTTAWVGWRDLTQAEKQLAETKEAWRYFEKTYEAERKRLKGKFDDAAVKKDATTQFENPLTHELRLEYPGGRAVERIIVLPGGRYPRVYFVGIAGRVEFDGPEAQRLFDSFRVSD